MAAQGLGWQSTWQASCSSNRCLRFRPALNCRHRPACRLAPICAHASVESMPRKPRPGEKKGVPRMLPSVRSCVLQTAQLPWLPAVPIVMLAQYVHAGFVEEMRFVAMRLHTKDQAPKEGGQKAAEQPFQKVAETLLAAAASTTATHAARSLSYVVSLCIDPMLAHLVLHDGHEAS